MVDIIAPVVVLLVVLVVVLHRTSAGVAVLALLAGVLLDQLLSAWVIAALPSQQAPLNIYVSVVVHLLITFTPMVVALAFVKATRQSLIVPILTGLVLGFLVVYFGLRIVAPLPAVTKVANKSGLITFLGPYQNAILAASAVLAILAMVIDHRKIRGKKDK